MGCSRVC
jgi:hypothetical protein